jgi:hypothetical protein
MANPGEAAAELVEDLGPFARAKLHALVTNFPGLFEEVVREMIRSGDDL